MVSSAESFLTYHFHAMPEEPKRPQTAFFMWMNTNRERLNKEVGTAPGAVAKLASQTWKAMSIADKKPYEDKFSKAWTSYEKDLEAFKAAGGQARKRKQKENAGGNKKVAKREGCPKKPIGGGYGQFLAEVRAELTEKFPPGAGRFTQVTKAAGEKWKALPAAKQEHYNKMYQEKLKTYKVEFDKFMKEQGDLEEDGKDGEDDGEDDEESDE